MQKGPATQDPSAGIAIEGRSRQIATYDGMPDREKVGGMDVGSGLPTFSHLTFQYQPW